MGCGSNSSPGFARVRATYGSIDLDNEDIGGNGWFTKDPKEVSRFGGQWKTIDYTAGDVVIFTMRTFHGSSVNQLDRWRLSFDVRFKPEEQNGGEDSESVDAPPFPN